MMVSVMGFSRTRPGPPDRLKGSQHAGVRRGLDEDRVQFFLLEHSAIVLVFPQRMACSDRVRSDWDPFRAARKINSPHRHDLRFRNLVSHVLHQPASASATPMTPDLDPVIGARPPGRPKHAGRDDRWKGPPWRAFRKLRRSIDILRIIELRSRIRPQPECFAPRSASLRKPARGAPGCRCSRVSETCCRAFARPSCRSAL